MDSASFPFVLFGLGVAAISSLSRSARWRSSILLVASLIFLGLLDRHPLAFLPLAGFLLLGYGALILIQRGVSRSLLIGSLAVVFVYIWLKKYTFLPHAIFLHGAYFTIGLSYIFFRVLHLLIETGNAREQQDIGFWPYLLYTLNFTTLISGPIQTYDDFLKQFTDDPIPLGTRFVGSQLERIVRGYFKVNVLALFLNMLEQDALLQIAQPVSAAAKCFAAFRVASIYPLFLYANFSGYIDIVIAIALLLRVRVPENFDRPFSATCFLDFWSKWHMTLSNWFKTYVYNPMLIFLMRRISSLAMEPFIVVACFFVTFFLVGIWHGRTSEFVFYGILQGGGVSINKIWQLILIRRLGRKGYRSLASNAVYNAFGRGLTFSWFALTLFWLWAGWKQLGAIYHAITVPQWLLVWLAIFLVATVVLAAWEWLRSAILSIQSAGEPVFTSRYALVVYTTVFGLSAFVMEVLLSQPAPEIVYKAF